MGANVMNEHFLVFRLVAIWRDLYRQALEYQNDLRSDRSLASRNRELENISEVISQIQQSLQRAGDHLEDSPALYNITGSTQCNNTFILR